MNKPICLLSLIVSLTTICHAELRIPAFSAYLSPDVRGARMSEANGITRWTDPALKVLWFGQIRSTGSLDCAVELVLPQGKTSQLRLTVAGQTSEASATGTGAQPVTADFGSFQIEQAGYQQFALESLNEKGQPFGNIKTLILKGPATEDAHFNLKARRNAASVHLKYPVPANTKVAAFTCEMTALEDPVWSYYMACGWHRGYFGMQVNSPTERRIIFSVWDSGNEAVDRNKVNADDRVTLVAKGEDVYSGSFGNEGTGGHSHLKYPWRTGEKQRFMVTAEPTDATHTIYSGFYFHPDKKAWILVSSWRAPKEGGFMRGLYSFSENFSGQNGHTVRKALYGNQWIRTDQGQWTELTTATFSHDATGKADRLDRFMGVEDGQFFLSHGGFVPGFTEFGTPFKRPATKQVPEVGLPQALDMQSPDGKIALSFDVKDMASEQGVPVYSVAVDGQKILADSRLGFELTEDKSLTDAMTLGTVRRSSNNSSWQPVYGEKSLYQDHYNEMTVSLHQTKAPFHLVDITFRCYDTGVAFRSAILPSQRNEAVQIQKEHTEFSFLENHTAWVTRSAQGDYKKLPISNMGKKVERPLTLRLNDSLYVAIAEAGLVDYARMKLGQSPERPLTVVSELSSPVHATLPLTTPWRVLMIAHSPGELLENNGILLNLNAPCAINDTSWIKPGKVIREVTLTTQGGKTCVDFARAHNLQYVEFDAGWYGHEYDNASDATTITVDPKRSPGPLDLHEVIRYGKEQGISILLYVNQRALSRQLDDVLPLLQQWGVAGVKYGFVNVGSQEATTWLHRAIRKAAHRELMIDVHDEYRPTGYSRTYPNFMTQEGIRGDETSPSNQTTLTILFTRMLAGAGDNTICYYDSRVEKNASHAYQLAKAVCLYSPWQFLYWYDRPAGSPGTEGAGGGRQGIGDEPELAFFDAVPTVWDDTKVIHGRIGEYAVIARRSGTDWFIGSMNSGQKRTLDIPLDFLEPEKTYTAHIYSDDPTIPTRTHVRIDHQDVTAKTTLQATLTAQGGQAIHLELKR